MTEIDKRGRLAEKPFSFRVVKEGRVLLYWEEKHVKTISGGEAEKFLQRISGLEEDEVQLVLAKITGNFKRGNERNNSRK